MTQLYVTGPSRDWRGVCEIDEAKPNMYRHHPDWPIRDDVAPWLRLSFSVESLLELGCWQRQVLEEWLVVPEGL